MEKIKNILGAILSFFIKVLGEKEVQKIILDQLETESKKTSNEIDENIIAIVRMGLNNEDQIREVKGQITDILGGKK